MPDPQDRSNTEPDAASESRPSPESPQLSSTPSAKKAPAKKAPAKKAPAKKAPAKKAPAEPGEPTLTDAAKDVAAQAKAAVEIAENPVALNSAPAGWNRFIVPLGLSTVLGGLTVLLIRKLRCRRCGTATR